MVCPTGRSSDRTRQIPKAVKKMLGTPGCHRLFGCVLCLVQLFFYSSSIAKAQGLDNLWQGGFENWGSLPWGGSNIEFDTGIPTIYVQSRSVDLYHTTANICDSSGNLQFFTNGVVVATASGDTMANGVGLNPSIYTDDFYPEGLLLYQANLIIPVPGASNRFYLFHNTIDSLPENTAKYLYLTEVDMSLNGGVGAVISKNQIIHTGHMQSGHLTAVRHGNGQDWWVYAYDLASDAYLCWMVTPSGLTGPSSQSVGVDRTRDAGQMVFSSDGVRFAYFSGLTGLDVFLLDRCTSSLVEIAHVDVPNNQYPQLYIGAAFSPSGRFVYLSAAFDLYQVDLDVPDPQSSMLHIAIWDSTYSPSPPFATLFGASKLAPDGKIYISTLNGTDKLHVINQPDSLGLACDLVQHGITLPTYWKNSLPNHPNYHLGPLVGSPCDTLDLAIAEQDVRLNLSLFPNPNVGSFSLSFAPQPGAGVVEVFDVNGRVVHSEGVAPWSQLKRMELAGLSAGVYQCRLRFGQAVATKRFVVE